MKINKEASPARVALGIMTVLSMSTLGFGLRTDLPKVSHHTALDIYILLVKFAQFFGEGTNFPDHVSASSSAP